MPHATTLYPTGPFNYGGRMYVRDEPLKNHTLTDEEVEFYKRRGILNTAPRKGADLTRIASAPVAPMTTEDAPNKPPVEEKPVPIQEPPKDAAAQLAERTRLAAEKLNGKKNK
jgi:hypothetical protein